MSVRSWWGASILTQSREGRLSRLCVRDFAYNKTLGIAFHWTIGGRSLRVEMHGADAPTIATGGGGRLAGTGSPGWQHITVPDSEHVIHGQRMELVLDAFLDRLAQT